MDHLIIFHRLYHNTGQTVSLKVRDKVILARFRRIYLSQLKHQEHKVQMRRGNQVTTKIRSNNSQTCTIDLALSAIMMT